MGRVRRAVLAAVLAGSGAVAAIAGSPAVRAAVPAGFADDPVASVPAPTALDFTPDGRMLITTQPGALRVLQGGSLVAAPAVDLSAKVCANSERACSAWPSTRRSPPTASCSSTTRSTRTVTAARAP